MTPAEVEYLRKSLPQNDAVAGGTYRLPGRLALAVGGYVTKAIDRGKNSVQSVLSFPGRDYDGDTINPAGGDWRREFAANPVVNWTHGVPVARGSVPELKSFDVDGQQMLLPVGTTRFFQSKADTRGLKLFGRDAAGRAVHEYTADECLHAADSAARIVLDGIADGVSVEFKPDGVEGKAFWQTGADSLLLGRPEMHWEKWVGMGWAHALHVKNPNAAVIQDKAFKIAESGRIGSHAVSPFVLKAFAPLLARKPKYVRVERKAMNDEMLDDAPPGVEDAAPVDAGGGKGMKPTPTAYMSAIQHLQDGKQAIQDLLDGGALEHEKGIAGLEDHLEELQSLCDDLNAKAGKMFPDAGFEAKDAAPEAEAGPVETNDDGAVENKAFPGGFPVRFRVAKAGGYERVETPKAAPEPDGETVVLEKAIADKRDELARRIKRAERREEHRLRVEANNRRNGRI